jgi:hypothetical protein
MPGRNDGILPRSLRYKQAEHPILRHAVGGTDVTLIKIHVTSIMRVTCLSVPLLQTEGSLIAMASFIQNIFIFPLFGNAETARPETARPTHLQTASNPTTGGAEEPIYFYNSDKPYFESAKLSLAIRFSPLIRGCFTPLHQVYELLRSSR